MIQTVTGKVIDFSKNSKEEILDQYKTFSPEQKKVIFETLIQSGRYNIAAELAESGRDASVTEHVYGKIAIYGAEKNDIFLVTQFAGSMHDVQKKDQTLERAAKIIAAKGPHWIHSSDLKEIIKGISNKGEQDRVASECKELIGNRKV